MINCSSKNRNALEIILLAVVLLVAYALFQRVSETEAILLESNLQSNLARISRYLHAPKVDTVLVGSSVAGRLLPEYFRNQGMEVSNLGLDGCSTLYGLEIAQKRKDLPKLLLVDTSTLFKKPNANEAILQEALESPTFKMGAGFPLFRPENRPLSLLYWFTKKTSDNKSGARVHGAWVEGKSPSDSLLKEGESLLEDDNDRVIKKALLRLKDRNVEVFLVEIPRADGWGYPRRGRLRKISEETGVPLLEPGVGISKTTDKLHFTDGLHLDVPSARAVSRTICEQLGGSLCKEDPKDQKQSAF